MKIKTIYQIFFLAVLLLSFSCKKDKNKVDVQGLIIVYSQTGKMLNPEGIEVTMNGIDTPTYTNTAGLFRFKDVPIGTYNITYKREGCPEYKIYNYKIIGNGQPVKYIATKSIAEYPTIEVTDFKDTCRSFWQDVEFVVKKNGLNENDKYVLICCRSSSPDVSLGNCEFQNILISDEDSVHLSDYVLFRDSCYIVFYSFPYSSHGFNDNDSIIVQTPLSPAYDSLGNEYYPYYVKVSDVHYHKKVYCKK